jgi:DNA-binding NtrC family response regulator
MADRILIADSDTALSALYGEKLSREGLVVCTATNGLECLQALRTFRPTLLVLEPDIPWGGGVGVLTVMHDRFDLPLVPVFVITSPENFASLDESHFARKFPLVTHMQTKPVQPDELVRLIRHISNEPRLRREDLRKFARSDKGRKSVGVKDGGSIPKAYTLIGVKQ